MKKFDKLMVATVLVYILLAGGIWLAFHNQKVTKDREYQVEINRLMHVYEKDGKYESVKLSDYPGIHAAVFLSKKDALDKNKAESFYQSTPIEGEVFIQPLYISGELDGYVRFTYIKANPIHLLLKITELAMALLFICVIAFLLYIKRHLLVPFQELSEMPYELSKGHLKGELKEEKNRYFGRFIWGISMLRDNLNSHKMKELQLEHEKKLLLLSLSHDIKTPLNTIKLYAKALSEGVYDSEEKKQEAALHIGIHAAAIDDFVKEIIHTASEDILEIEVVNSEFYLKELVDKVRLSYGEKCRLQMIEFSIERYENKLIKADFDRSFEVIENIMENAFKYGDGKCITMTFYEEDYCQLIRITNSGEAVREDELNHMFDSFYRGSNAQEKPGNGLGLYICREIMHKMDGEIFAECQADGMSLVIVFCE
jgi:signal transduction histidine kinase